MDVIRRALTALVAFRCVRNRAWRAGIGKPAVAAIGRDTFTLTWPLVNTRRGSRSLSSSKGD